jgi:hypothetical protein
VVEVAKALNPGIEVIVHNHNEDEGALLEAEQVGKVFVAGHPLAHGMAGHELARMARTA